MDILSGKGKTVQIGDAAVDQLGSSLNGALVKKGDDGYDEARTIWNAMIDRYPALIARCTNAEDVAKSVSFAKDNGLLLAVRGGGHNIAGNAVCDGGFMIDLSLMNDVKVDAGARRVHVGPGATLGDLDAATLPHGLATPVGINSTTGVAGLALGGGLGWLSRKHGMTVDNWVAADVVTADGNKVTATADDHADLFWAIRGGGGNFGVVTRFEFELHPVGPDVFAGLIVYPYSEAKSVLEQYKEYIAQASDDMCVWVVMRQAPPLPFLPEDVHGKDVCVLAICYFGDGNAEELIAPLRAFGNAHGEHLGVQPFADWQQAFDPLLTPGMRNYWKSHNFTGLTDGLFDAMIEYAGKMPSPHCEVFLGAMGGAAGRIPADATAWVHRDANFILNVHGRWETAAEDDKCIGWSRNLFNAVAPFSTGGVYINFMTEEEKDRVRAAYGAGYDKLVAAKKKYDPDNLFRLNQNIKPTA
jgi:FAD/FMN-containing dehydrogenase